MFIYGNKEKKEKFIGLKEKIFSKHKYEVLYKDKSVGFISRKENQLKIKNGPTVRVQDPGLLSPWPTVWLNDEKLDILLANPEDIKKLEEMGLDTPVKKNLIFLPFFLLFVYIFTGPIIENIYLDYLFYLITAVFVGFYLVKKIFKKDLWKFGNIALGILVIISITIELMVAPKDLKFSIIIKDLWFLGGILSIYIIRKLWIKKKENG